MVQCQQLEEMFTENSTENQTLADTTKAILDYTTKAAAFFDSAWQIAITIEFYFQYVVIAIGVIGAAANSLVLYALISYYAREVKKRAINLLIIHQSITDLVSSVLLTITFSIGHRLYLTGTLGYLICSIFVGESAAYCATNASVINLMAVTIERYLKVVHPFWTKKNVKRWMIHATMAFAWIAAILFTLPPSFVTSVVMDGTCLSYYAWESPEARMIFGAYGTFSFFVLPVILFIYCYGHIVVVIRRQMRVMAGHSEGSSQMNANQIQSKRVKWNIIKTMIIVSVTFIICWIPNTIYFMIVDNTTQTTNLFIGYYFTIFLGHLNICMNPFIYAIKHEGVKEKLADMMICHKCKGPTAVGDNSGSSNTNVGRAQQKRTGVTPVV